MKVAVIRKNQCRVSSDLENLEMSGNFDARRKSLEKVREFLKNKKSQEKVKEFCCMEFIFSQSEHPNFENFLGEHAPGPPLTVLDTHKNLIVVWKSQGISSLLETGHPANGFGAVCKCEFSRIHTVYFRTLRMLIHPLEPQLKCVFARCRT